MYKMQNCNVIKCQTESMDNGNDAYIVMRIDVIYSWKIHMANTTLYIIIRQSLRAQCVYLFLLSVQMSRFHLQSQ